MFSRIEALQSMKPWGRVLDAGIGKKSLEWVLSLDTASVSGITSSERIHKKSISGIDPDRLKQIDLRVSKWSSDVFANETFDTVLMDYVIGTLDATEPFTQELLFKRVKSLLAKEGIVYIVAKEPFPDSFPSETANLIIQTAKLRDAAIITAGGRPIRDYPLQWFISNLIQNGFDILAVEMFPVVYGKAWINYNLNKAELFLRSLEEDEEYSGFHAKMRSLRSKASMSANLDRGFCLGSDFVIAAKVSFKSHHGSMEDDEERD